MKSLKILFVSLFLLSATIPCFSYICIYKENFYKLYHVHFQQYPDDVMENICWLEKAVKADFCNPRYALAKIENEEEWEKYRYIFMMHLNLKLIEQHLRLGLTWDKGVAYFYDAPWKEQYIKDLETAEACYKTGLYYWQEAKLWAEKASEGKFKFLTIYDLQNWEDERYRIINGSLDYEKILTRELNRIEKMKQTFLEMNENTY